MAKRQSDVLRNLDDSLKVLNFLTLKSCGVVMMFFSAAYALEALFGLWKLFFGGGALLVIFGATAAAAVTLSWVENREDEHLVPSALRYYLTRPWRVLYSGACNDGFAGRSLEQVLGE